MNTCEHPSTSCDSCPYARYNPGTDQMECYLNKDSHRRQKVLREAEVESWRASPPQEREEERYAV